MNPFDRLAKLALGRKRRFGFEQGFTGPREGADAIQGADWRAYRSSAALYELWGPPQASPWSAFHRPTLFAAADSIDHEHLWPSAPSGFAAVDHERRPPAWMDRTTAVLLDLPAAASIAWAALASLRGRHEPVATFNNWPHPKGLVDMWQAVGALLYFSPWQRVGRDNRRAAGDPSPPVFMLDRARLGARQPKPTDFDNRYYLLDSDLPTAAMLQRAGIERVVYVAPAEAAPEAAPELDDMNRYLHEISKRIPLQLARLPATSWGSSGDPEAWAPTLRKTPFNTVTDPAFHGFRRSAAGGFGELVPEPSSGGG